MTDDCANLGAEFNSLRRVETVRNPFGGIYAVHNLAEGALPDVTADENGLVTDFRVNDLFQNLKGDFGLLGRGMSLKVAGTDDILACCSIGLDIFRDPSTDD